MSVKEKRFPGLIKIWPGKEWFCDFIKEIVNQRKQTSLRNILYSLFPITEYLCETQGISGSIFSSYALWSDFAKANSTIIIELSVNHGTQGNIPQRAVIILDYVHKAGLVKRGENIVIELGCSGGLIGCVMENHRKLFVEKSGFLTDKYFWLKRKPKIEIQNAFFNYLGYDTYLPPKKFLPFFIWDKEKRRKVEMFINDFQPKGLLLQQPVDRFFEVTNIFSSSPIIIITSFMFYQFRDAKSIQEKILEKIKHDVHWIDLSRNNNLPFLFKPIERFVPNHTYLSHNGNPVAKIIDGSDDCPNWEYL